MSSTLPGLTNPIPSNLLNFLIFGNFFPTHRQTHTQSGHPYYISRIVILASHSIALDESLQIARSNMSRHIHFRSLTDNGDRSINLNEKHVWHGSSLTPQPITKRVHRIDPKQGGITESKGSADQTLSIRTLRLSFTRTRHFVTMDIYNVCFAILTFVIR